MAPTTAQEEVKEASGSRSSRAGRRRRRRTPAVCPAPPTRTTRSRVTKSGPPPPPPPPAPPTRTTRSRVAKSEPPPTPKSSRPPIEQRSKKRKRATKSNTFEQEEEEEEVVVAAGASASPTAEEAAAAAAAGASASSPAADEGSSAVSSPLRFPYLPRTVKGVDSSGREILEPFININPSIVLAQQRLRSIYYAKRDIELKLPSLDRKVPSSCLVKSRLIDVRASATKTVLQISKAVLSLSSSLDGLQLECSSGFLIDWDADSKIGTILTSAHLIRSKSPSVDEWLARDEYAPHAKVYVHLPDKDDTNTIAHLVHYDKHFNIALFETTVDLSAPIPPFTSEVTCGQEVFILGRDQSRYLSIDHGKVDYRDPGVFERYHYMFVNCGIDRPAIGGPVINFDGEIVGMAFDPQTTFIPSSIILKCLDLWKKFNCIPRLHIGMKFAAIIFLDPAHIEKISRKCGIDDGLIVEQVSEGSVAEKLGIRAGDVIKDWNGEKISTTVELENFLLSFCEEHLDRGNTIGSSVNLMISMLHMRKDSNDTIKLTANVSTDVEIILEGKYAVTSKDCTPEDEDDEVCGSGTAADDNVGYDYYVDDRTPIVELSDKQSPSPLSHIVYLSVFNSCIRHCCCCTIIPNLLHSLSLSPFIIVPYHFYTA